MTDPQKPTRRNLEAEARDLLIELRTVTERQSWDLVRSVGALAWRLTSGDATTATFPSLRSAVRGLAIRIQVVREMNS